MDTKAVIEAVGILRDRLDSAIHFSAGAEMLNAAGGRYLTSPEQVERYFQKACAEHTQWQGDIRQAIETLDAEGYLVLDSWRNVSIEVPQICFSEIPIERYTDGTPTGKVWLIGGGENPEQRRIPEGAPDLYAGDVLFVSGKCISLFPDRYATYRDHARECGIDSTECDQLAGVFDDRVVRDWQAVYRDLAETERRLVESLVKHTLPRTPTEERARFCFDEWQKGRSLKEINAALKRHPEWEHFEDEKAVRGPINTWGKRIGVEPRKGQPGRPAKN